MGRRERRTILFHFCFLQSNPSPPPCLFPHLFSLIPYHSSPIPHCNHIPYPHPSFFIRCTLSSIPIRYPLSPFPLFPILLSSIPFPLSLFPYFLSPVPYPLSILSPIPFPYPPFHDPFPLSHYFLSPTPYPLSLFPYSLSPIHPFPYPFSPIPYPRSLFPYPPFPLSLFSYSPSSFPRSLFPYPLYPISYPLSLIPYFLSPILYSFNPYSLFTLSPIPFLLFPILLSSIPFPLSLIPYFLSPIPFPLFLIPYSLFSLSPSLFPYSLFPIPFLTQLLKSWDNRDRHIPQSPISFPYPLSPIPGPPFPVPYPLSSIPRPLFYIPYLFWLNPSSTMFLTSSLSFAVSAFTLHKTKYLLSPNPFSLSIYAMSYPSSPSLFQSANPDLLPPLCLISYPPVPSPNLYPSNIISFWLAVYTNNQVRNLLMAIVHISVVVVVNVLLNKYVDGAISE